MKTILKDLKTGLFFKHMDEWTGDIAQAAVFRDPPAALKFCRRNNLVEIAILQVLKSDSSPRIAGFHRKSPAIPPATAAL